jgi:hypothetical protein
MVNCRQSPQHRVYFQSAISSLRQLRGDEVLGPVFAHQPDNSVAVIDAVTKDMRDRGVALGNAANPLATLPAHPRAAAFRPMTTP